MQGDDDSNLFMMAYRGRAGARAPGSPCTGPDVLDLALKLKQSVAACTGKLQAIYGAAEAARAAARECSTDGSTLAEVVQDAAALQNVWRALIHGGAAASSFLSVEWAALMASRALARRAKAMSRAVHDAESASDVTSVAAEVSPRGKTGAV